jgi:aminobenzoyl-glutamate utilization protein B
MQSKQDLIQWLEDNQARFNKMADDIWANPEIAWEEFFAAELQAESLQKDGFNIYSFSDLPTAFVAEWGSGSPIIGFIGEYDALPGLSQKCQTTQDPLEDGGHGHGCGHNLLGTAGVASAVAIKKWLEATGTPGTVRYYGCPAEERGNAKTYMARAGSFDDLDVAFNFHPMSVNIAHKSSSVGVYDVKFRFYGRTSHAGGSPHLGRSALDAVELMNVGVNYLREHVLSNIRMHYVITAGGEAPNIVPDFAEVWYYLRAHLPEEHQDLIERVRKIAQGAAMMTETTTEEVFGGACSSVLSSHTLADLQYEAMKVIGPIQFTDEEKAFSETIGAEYPAEMFEDSIKALVKNYGLTDEQARNHLPAENFPPGGEGFVMGGSTDVGDLSWCTPVSMVTTACFPMAAPGHSWGNTSTSGMSIGHKGMIHAAKIMALAAMDCYTDPTHVEKAREEFKQSTKGEPYKAMIPDEIVRPPAVSDNLPSNNLVGRFPQFPQYDRDRR